MRTMSASSDQRGMKRMKEIGPTVSMKGKVEGQRKRVTDNREGDARTGGWAGMQANIMMQASARLKIQQVDLHFSAVCLSELHS